MRSYRLSTCFRQRKHSCFVQLACWLVSYSTLATVLRLFLILLDYATHCTRSQRNRRLDEQWLCCRAPPRC